MVCYCGKQCSCATQIWHRHAQLNGCAAATAELGWILRSGLEASFWGGLALIEFSFQTKSFINFLKTCLLHVWA